MNERPCPACKIHTTKSAKEFSEFFECDVCRGLDIEISLVSAPTTLDNWPELLGAARELREQFSHTPLIRSDGTVTCPDDDGREHSVSRFPTSIPERAHKLLAALVKRSGYFGQMIRVNQNDYPLAYVAAREEFYPYVNYLKERGLIVVVERLSVGIDLKVCAEGFNAVSESTLLPEITVFISSTCYDLRDLRSELAQHLQSLGCQVRASDDPLQFDVSPSNDSLQSCLLNVAHSDLVLCVIDQRYGPPLTDGDFVGISATHAEIRFARAKRIPIYFFIRKEAFTEWAMLKRDSAARTAWVEPRDEELRKFWTDFVSEFTALPTEEGASNWFDQFTSVVDLKRIVTARVKAFRTGRV